MRLREAYLGDGATVRYMLPVGGGLYSVSDMPAPVALEIAQTSADPRVEVVNGREYLHVDHHCLLDVGAFHLDDGLGGD